MSRFFLAVSTLWLREMVRFYRQPSRVIGALGSPLVFWLLIGAGLGNSFQAPGSSARMSYLEYFFPGTLLLILLFTAIFSTISLIEDRREGFLQSVLVAPVPRASFVFGKILGGTTLALSQGILFLLIAPFIGIRMSAAGWLQTGAILFLNGFALTGLGFLIAWRLHSIQGFHAIMNLFLIPLWLLSGALFPPEGAPGWIRLIMRLNPLSYGMASLRHSLFKPSDSEHLPSLGISIGITFLAGIFLFILASFAAGRRSARDLS